MGYAVVAEQLESRKKHLVVQIAPAIRVSLGEEFGFEAGTVLTGEVVTALKKLGFDSVFDTSFGADVVVMEETTKLAEHMQKRIKPVLTSCCSGFVNYVEHAYPDKVDFLCRCKSPMEALGTLIKTYYAEKKGIKPEDIYSVAVMPCMAKKVESKRSELKFNGMQVIDHVLTTRELAQFLKERKINLKKLKGKKTDFDSLLGHASGAGQIFGVTGGIAEAVFRRLAEKKGNGKEKIEFKEVRGLEGVKEGYVKMMGKDYHWAVINGVRSVPQIFENEKLFKKYDFIEVMFCFGGCIGGPGQPSTTKEKIEKRKNGLYAVDNKEKVWSTDINPETMHLYKEYLGKVGSKKAGKLFNTTFNKFYK